MIEKWRKALDTGKLAGAVFTDLSKAFDCLPHDLFIAKLHAYGFDLNALNYIHTYLTGRKQRVKINSKYSDQTEIMYGVPQGSILGPLFFNIHIQYVTCSFKLTKVSFLIMRMIQRHIHIVII